MIFSGLTPAGDWTFGLGQGNYLTGNAAIGADIKTSIYSWFGDCFFDTTAGIDWVNRIGSKGQQNLLELDLRRIILQRYGVTSINSFNFTLIGRKFSAAYNINTIFSRDYINSLNQNFQGVS